MADKKEVKTEEATTTEEVKEVAAPAEEAKKEVKKEAASSEEKKEEAGEEVEVPAKFKDLVGAVENMSVLDLHELVKLLEKKFGVSAAAVAVAGVAAGAGAEVAEEKSIFNAELTDAGAQKIQVIKAIKEVLGLGLKEAKDLVDSAPAMLKEGMKKEDAEALKAKVEEAGGKVELK